MFDKLFKFDSIQFAEGEIGFQAGQMAYVFGFIVLFLVVGFCIVYFVTNIYTSDRARAISLGIRIPALLLLCIPLFEPVLISPDVVPDENFVAVVVDGSASMAIPDGEDGETRSEAARRLLYNENNGVLADIEENFKVRYYTFSDDAFRTDSLVQDDDGRETNLTTALDRVLSDFKGLPLSGIVLMTDGGDNSTDVPLNKAEELRGLDIPLHIVGLGEERFEQEREILDVVVSKGVGDATGAEIDVKVRSWVAETQPVTFNIYQGETLVFTEDQRLKGGGKIDQLAFFYEPQETGAQEYRIEITESANELNTANNSLDMLIDTRKDTLRVLYFEGHLRQDFKFIKRALEDDQVVEFTSISRTGTGKIYRQGIKTPDELAGGFPIVPEDLYAFKAVILGDVEASAFSLEQLRMIEQFVRIRGGGFLMMGGRQSFAEGDYWNTPIADLLPVELDPSRRAVIPRRFSNPTRPSEEEEGFKFVPTAAGLENPILKFSPDPVTNRARWSDVPTLTSINLLGAIKPGAVVLAEKPDDDFGEREPLLVVQRYGKGRTAALATASTWRWQMKLEAEDTRHERFWQQLARWMAAEAPNRVNIDMGQARFAPDQEIPMTVNVYGAAYRPLGGAEVRGLLTDPFGGVRQLRFEEELTAEGTYTAPYVPLDNGVYELEVVAETEAGEIGSHTRSFLVRPSNKEFYDATLKRTFLEGLVTANDGYYYEPSEVDAMPVNLRSRRTSTSIFRAEYLWDMPLLFGLVILLLSIEWMYRRRKGLP